MSETNKDEQWAKDALVKLAEAGLEEQRKTRKWGIVFKLLGLGYLVFGLIVFVGLFDGAKIESSVTEEHTAVVDIFGLIAEGGDTRADDTAGALRSAFDNEHAQALILRINSPGGTPVQAGYIHDEILRLKETRPDFPVYAVIGDVCASGGYYVAVAADEIYADKASLVGSIGVRMDSFGFVDAMDKLGVERRQIAAGEHKLLLDPFSPLKQSEVTHMREVLKTVHDQFIDVVKAGRGEKLDESVDLFSGLIWSGEQAVDLGLVDDLASPGTVARDVVGVEKIVNYTTEEDFLQKLTSRMEQSMSNALVNSLLVPRLQ